MARLRQFLRQTGLEDNTILIFMTDNGSSGGARTDDKQFATRGYNAGMRGMKGSYYDGGHRVPFFIRWPAGGLTGGLDIDDLVLHIDLLPTFIDICGLPTPDGARFDGISIAPLLRGDIDELPDRVTFVQYNQGTEAPQKWTNAVMTKRWRLIRGKELYDIKADPGQENDIAAEHPDVVERLRKAHEDWWDEVAPDRMKHFPITIGSDQENPTRLDAFDFMSDDVAPMQGQIRNAKRVAGSWCVDVEHDGTYEFRVQRWPVEADSPIRGALADGGGTAIAPTKVRLKIGGFEGEADIDAAAKSAVFRTQLTAGETTLEARFVDDDGTEYAAYYVYVERLHRSRDR